MTKELKSRSLKDKILGALRPKHGVNPHKYDPINYFKQFWYNKLDTEHAKLIGDMEQINDKAAAHMLQEYGFKYYVIKNILEEIDNNRKPEEAIELALMTRRIWKWRVYCRQHGVDPNTFNFLSGK